MSIAAAPTAAKKSGFGVFKAALGGFAGLATGVIGVYATALVDQVAKPGKPIANFEVRAEGLTANFQNHATGQTGWWDFGDGSPLEPFEPEKSVVHTYAKPGSYSAKLTVRNFLMEENDRSVPVDLNANAGPAGGPAINDFTVEPIGGFATAPATFRLRGEVKNAERVIWDLGGDKLEVTDSPGVFEKLIVIERPGTFPIQMIGLAGKTPVRKMANVTVAAPSNGAFSVVLKITDSGSQVERKEIPQTVSLPIPAKDPKPVERVLNAAPGFTIAEAKLGKVASPALKNVKVEVAADKKSAKLTAEWASSGDAAQKVTGGSDVMVPVTLVQEKSTPTNLPVAMLASAFTGEGGFVMQNSVNPARSASIELPPAPAGLSNSTRKIQLDIQEMIVGKGVASIGKMEDLKLPLRASITSMATGQVYIVEASIQKNGSLRVVLTPHLGPKL